MNVDAAWIRRWSDRYLEGLTPKQRSEEEALLLEVGPVARTRGHYLPRELLRINKWKLPTERNRSQLARNSEQDIVAATKLAFSVPTHLQLDVLVGFLHGVSDAVASAFLIFPFPDDHTVIDFRAARALEGLRRLSWIDLDLRWRPREDPDDGWAPPYLTYLQACKTVAERAAVGLRDLDRALWQWHKEGMPES